MFSKGIIRDCADIFFNKEIKIIYFATQFWLNFTGFNLGLAITFYIFLKLITNLIQNPKQIFTRQANDNINEYIREWAFE